MDNTQNLSLTDRFKILAPFQIRDFTWLWIAMATSMLGDGIFLVALPWQVYELSNTPTALSMVGLAWTVPMVVFLLFGGAMSDRLSRRKMMMAAHVMCAVAVGVLGLLSMLGIVELWHIGVLVALYGAGDALFMPAFASIVPDIVPQRLLVEANSIDRLMQPLAMRFLGPALGGVVVSVFGAGEAFAIDGATFAISAAALLKMSARPARKADSESSSVLAEIAQGARFVRSQTWLWATMVAGGIAMLVFWGPYEVLIPYLIKNQYGGDPGDFGALLAMGGVGSIVAALWISQRGLPRRSVTFMFTGFAVAFLAVGAYGIANATWQALIASLFVGGLMAGAMIVWTTLQQRLVPSALLGRVSSLDWFVVSVPVPLSFALTGPVSAWLGEGATLVVAGVFGFVIHIAFLFIPGVRDPETVEERREIPVMA